MTISTFDIYDFPIVLSKMIAVPVLKAPTSNSVTALSSQNENDNDIIVGN